jgi:hypothetical protein
MGRMPSNNRDIESNRETAKNSSCRDWAFVLMWSILGYMCIMATVLSYFNPSVLPLDLISLVFRKDLSPFFAFSSGSGHFAKPQGFKIVALVPFSYHERTEILDCYLQVGRLMNNEPPVLV